MRNLVLRHLSKLPEGQVAEDYDAEVVEASIDRCQAFLEAEGVAYWETSAIPDGVASAFRDYVAADVAHEFLPPSQAAPYKAAQRLALNQLRDFTASPNGSVRHVFF
jgi:hypothetical protein